MLPAGSLDQRITFQKKTMGRDSFGAPTETWANSINEVPAGVEYAGSREFPAEYKRYAETTLRFTVRLSSDTEPVFSNPELYRVTYSSKTWDITPPLAMGRRHREFYQIEAHETR